MNKWGSLLLAVSAISTSMTISFVLHAPWGTPNIYNDITGSFYGRCWVQSGSLPYIPTSVPGGCDYAFEYPVISGMILYAARLFGSSLLTFYDAVAAMSLAAAAAVAGGAWAISRKLGRELDPLYFLMPSFIVYGIYNFDIFHAAFAVLSILSFMTGKRTLSAVFLGLGVDTKLTSVVLLPVFLMEIRGTRVYKWIRPPAIGGTAAVPGPKAKMLSLAHSIAAWSKSMSRWIVAWSKGNKQRFLYLGAFAVVVAAVNLPFAALNLKNFLEGYQFVGTFGLEDAWYVWIFQNPSTWGWAKIFGIGISGILLLRIYSLRLSLVPKSALAIAAYLLGTYIYSPQLNIVLIPLLAAIEVRHPALYPWDGFNALVILTWFISPSMISGGLCPDGSAGCPTLAGTWAQLFALLRSGFLAWLCVGIAAGEGHSLTSWILARFRGFSPSEMPKDPLQSSSP